MDRQTDGQSHLEIYISSHAAQKYAWPNVLTPQTTNIMSLRKTWNFIYLFILCIFQLSSENQYIKNHFVDSCFKIPLWEYFIIFIFLKHLKILWNCCWFEDAFYSTENFQICRKFQRSKVAALPSLHVNPNLLEAFDHLSSLQL